MFPTTTEQNNPDSGKEKNQATIERERQDSDDKTAMASTETITPDSDDENKNARGKGGSLIGSLTYIVLNHGTITQATQLCSPASVSSSDSTKSISSSSVEQKLQQDNKSAKVTEQKGESRISFFIPVFDEIEKMRAEETEVALKKYMESASKILAEVNSSSKFKESFNTTLKMLCSEWAVRHAQNAGYSDATIIVGEILERLNNPFVIALIGDDVSYFQKHKDKQLSGWLLESACICGSEQVAEYIASERNKGSFECDDMSNALAYAISTGKKSFALKIANYFKEHGDNLNLASLSCYDTISRDTDNDPDTVAGAVIKALEKPVIHSAS